MFGWAGNKDMYMGEGGNLLRVSLDGTSRTTLLNDPSSQVIRPSSCAGGRYVVFIWANHGGNKKVNLWRVDADGSNPMQLTHGTTDVSGNCSPDGQWVYYENIDTLRMMRVRVNGGDQEEVPGTSDSEAYQG